jgi:hypothetical protein
LRVARNSNIDKTDAITIVAEGEYIKLERAGRGDCPVRSVMAGDDSSVSANVRFDPKLTGGH